MSSSRIELCVGKGGGLFHDGVLSGLKVQTTGSIMCLSSGRRP